MPEDTNTSVIQAQLMSHSHSGSHPAGCELLVVQRILESDLLFYLKDFSLNLGNN